MRQLNLWVHKLSINSEGPYKRQAMRESIGFFAFDRLKNAAVLADVAAWAAVTERARKLKQRELVKNTQPKNHELAQFGSLHQLRCVKNPFQRSIAQNNEGFYD
jgi:hypothetical protein